jgi:hypothetical protein
MVAKAQAQPDIADAIQDGWLQLERIGTDPPRFRLLWPKVGKSVGISLSAEELWSWTTVQRKMFEQWRVMSYDMTARQWHQLLGILDKNANVVPEHGASQKDVIADLLEHWLKNKNTSRWSVGDVDHLALYKDGFYYFRLAALQSALYTEGSPYYYQRYLMPRSKVCEILGSLGADHKNFKFKGGKTRYLWYIRDDFNEPQEPAQEELIPDDEAPPI